jgi:arylsulfatase A-like enzyme
VRAGALVLLLVTACGGAPTRTVHVELADLVLDGAHSSVQPEGATIDHLRVRPAEFEPEVLGGARELPAWLLPPAATLDIQIPSGLAGELALRGGFAFDFVECKRRPKAFSARVEAIVERVRGDHVELLFSAELEARGKTPLAVGWRQLEGPGGTPLQVRAGDHLRIRTRLLEGKATNLPKLGIAGLALQALREVEPEAASPEWPNIVLVVMDTLSASHTSTFGNPNATTPHLDALARRGTAYDEARASSSWTWPSTASILTGLDPLEHGVTEMGSAWLAADLRTLAERLQSADLTTAAFTGNRLISADFHFDQGFDTFRGPERNAFIDGAELMPPALAWLEDHADERFFLYLHLVDPHRPYEPLPESKVALPGEKPADLPKLDISKHVAELYPESCRIPDRFARPLLTSMLSPRDLAWMDRSYDQAIHTGDVWLGRLVAELRALGLDDRTVVVFTSDHGEESYEHGDISHGQSLFPELLHVPLVLAGPGVPQSGRVPGALSNATLFDYIGGLGEEGSKAPLPRVEPEEPVFSSTSRGQWDGERGRALLGVELGGWALHVCLDTGAVRLYALASDPDEHHDVATENPAVVARLRALVDEHQRTAEERRAKLDGLGVGGDTVETLEDIGYL